MVFLHQFSILTHVMSFLVGTYWWLFTDLADKRTNNWLLIPDPTPLLFIVLSYLWFTLKWGPNFMRNRKPLNLTKFIIPYNAAQIAVNTFILYEALDSAWLRNYSWKCQPVDYSDNANTRRIAITLYIYFLDKISELLDTVFIILRKKDNQLSFLHLFHHTVMPFIGWIGVKYLAGGHCTLIAVLNTFVHVIMYSYYTFSLLFSAKFPKVKKYVTLIQLIQFTVGLTHTCQLFIYDCDYPRRHLFVTLPLALVIFYCFIVFYKKNYIDKSLKSD